MTGTGTWSFLQTQEPGVSFKPDNKQLQQNISCAWKFSPGTTTVNHGKNRKLTNTQKTNHNRPEPQPQWVKVFCNSLPATGDTTSALIHNCWQLSALSFWSYLRLLVPFPPNRTLLSKNYWRISKHIYLLSGPSYSHLYKGKMWLLNWRKILMKEFHSTC